MDEQEARTAIVNEALSWVGTPYHSNAAVKGNTGGTDCAMLLVAVYSSVGVIPEIDPRPYSPQWHIHRNEEEYLAAILRYAKEVVGPPERVPKPGDVALFRIGNLFAHGAIVVDWPNVVHAIGDLMVIKEDVSKNVIGKRALWNVPKRFFTLWT